MYTLHALLKHDDGRTPEHFIIGCEPNDWREAFDHLVNCHCRTGDVEMFPLYISLMAIPTHVYIDDEMDMSWIEDVDADLDDAFMDMMAQRARNYHASK